MNSRLFHLQGVGCNVINCTQVAKQRKKMTTKQKEKNCEIASKLR